MRNFFDIDDLDPGAWDQVLALAFDPPTHAPLAGRAWRSLPEAVGADPQLHRDGGGRPGRAPRLHPGDRGRPGRARDRGGRRPHPGLLPPCPVRTGVRARRAGAHGGRTGTDGFDVPVVNLLCDTRTLPGRGGRAHHARGAGPVGRPCADIVGDGNNMARSLAEAALLEGMEVRFAIRPATRSRGELAGLQAFGDRMGRGGTVQVTDDPGLAAKDAAVLYADVWTSMGQEEERAARPGRLRGLHRRCGPGRAGGRRRRSPALPAGAPWRGDQPRGARGPALAGLARGGPPAHRHAGDPVLGRRGGPLSGQAPSRLTKNQRQHRITKMLESQPVTNQAQLVVLLGEQGIDATQTTVSRDLEDLGAVKVRLPGGETAYALPELPVHQIAPEDHLRRVLGEWVVEVAHSGNLVVLRTPPGSAHVVGLRARSQRLEDVVGTVAGDDTVLVVVDEACGGAPNGGSPAGRRGHCQQRQDRIEWEGRGLNMADRVVLAYSGGLDTSVAVRWLIEHEGVDVVAVAVDVGQSADRGGEDWDAVRTGPWPLVRSRPSWWTPATKWRSSSACRRCRPTRYEGKYPLVSALSGRSSCATWWPRLARTAPRPWRTAARARGTTRCVSRSGCAPWHRISAFTRGPGLGSVPGGLRRAGGQMGDPDHRHQGEAVLHRRQPLGQGDRVWRHRGPVGARAR